MSAKANKTDGVKSSTEDSVKVKPSLQKAPEHSVIDEVVWVA